jgi:hypothetical protein
MMKIVRIILFCLTPTIGVAQTITLGSITKTSYCVGDTLFVPYIATGSFSFDNHFFLELSDANGSFTAFKTIGSKTSQNSVFLIPMSEAGSHYRVKVASSNPFAVSSDNGVDITVITASKPDIRGNGVRASRLYALTNELVTFQDVGSEPPNTKFLWTFGQDASKTTDTTAKPIVSWATEGTKEVTVKLTYFEGCVDSLTTHYFVHVITCNPTIPSNSRIITGVEKGSDSVVWVKAGASYESHGFIYAFVESGGSLTVVNQGHGILYLKSNAAFAWQEQFATDFVVVSDTTTPVPKPCNTCFSFVCQPMSFSYTPPPPALVEASETIGIRLRQVPNHLFISSETNITINLTNILGKRILVRTGQGLFDLDLSELPSGVYFADIESKGRHELRRILK